MSVKSHRTGNVRYACCFKSSEQRSDMVVLDASGNTWMSAWDRYFKTFGISHLRSPMFFHIDPAERDGLLSYAHMGGRSKELTELRGCVGKELSSHRQKKMVKQRRK